MTPHTIEILIVTLVLSGIGFTAVQATLRRKGTGAVEYFLAGRNVSWWALAVSLAVTTIWLTWSIFTGIPVGPGLMAWVAPGGMAVAGLVMLGVVISMRYRDSVASTIPAFLGERYGRAVGVAVAIISIGITLLVSVPYTIFIGSRLLNALLGWELMSSALLVVVVTGLLVIPGGYTAVMAMHAAGGVAVGLGVLLLATGGFYPAGEIIQRIGPDPEASWMEVVAGLAIIGFWFTCIDQSVVQRVKAARSSAATRGGAALAALLVALGVSGIAVGFDVVPAEESRIIEAGVAAGFVGAAVVAFEIATLSTLFMSASTVFSMDLLRFRRAKEHDVVLVLVGRLANTGIVILTILAASSLALTEGRSIEWMVRAAAYALSPVVAILLLGLLWPRVHGGGAVWALVLGWSAGIAVGLVSAGGVGSVLEGVVATFALSVLVCTGVSLFTSPRQSPGRVAGTVVDAGGKS